MFLRKLHLHYSQNESKIYNLFYNEIVFHNRKKRSFFQHYKSPWGKSTNYVNIFSFTSRMVLSFCNKKHSTSFISIRKTWLYFPTTPTILSFHQQFIPRAIIKLFKSILIFSCLLESLGASEWSVVEGRERRNERNGMLWCLFKHKKIIMKRCSYLCTTGKLKY